MSPWDYNDSSMMKYYISMHVNLIIKNNLKVSWEHDRTGFLLCQSIRLAKHTLE